MRRVKKLNILSFLKARLLSLQLPIKWWCTAEGAYKDDIKPVKEDFKKYTSRFYPSFCITCQQWYVVTSIYHLILYHVNNNLLKEQTNKQKSNWLQNLICHYYSTSLQSPVIILWWAVYSWTYIINNGLITAGKNYIQSDSKFRFRSDKLVVLLFEN